MKKLAVIIVNYQSERFLRPCLTSLFESSRSLKFEVIVVNNDSRRDLASLSKSEWPEVEFVQNGSNLGYAAAANAGFRKSHQEFVLLLNPDVLVQPRSVDLLLETAEADPRRGLVLPQLLNPDGTLQYSCRRFYTYAALLMRRSPIGRIFPHHSSLRSHLMLDWNHEGLAEVDWGLGAAMLVRRAAIQEHFLFDERFFLYFEDVDLCLRMKRRGWKVLYVSEAKMIHQHQRDSAQGWLHPAHRNHLQSLIKFLWKYQFRISG